MINPYHSKIDIEEILRLQNFQYQDLLFGEIEIPANSTSRLAIQIGSLGHFMNLTITGAFTTKIAGPDDDGISRLTAQLRDANGNRQLFENAVPVELFLSPGRIQSIAGAGQPSNPLRLEFPFVYTFMATGEIIWEITNASDEVNFVQIAHKGIRIFTDNRSQQ